MTGEPPEDEPLDPIAAFLRNPLGNVQVGRLEENLCAALASGTDLVLLSADSLKKQKREYPELTSVEYLILPAVIQGPDLVLQWEVLRIAVLRAGSHDLVAVIKTTVERHENYVVSFRRTGSEDIRRMFRKARVVSGDVKKWSRR